MCRGPKIFFVVCRGVKIIFKSAYSVFVFLMLEKEKEEDEKMENVKTANSVFWVVNKAISLLKWHFLER